MTTTGNEIVATQVGMQPSTFPASTYEYPHLDVKPNVSVFDNMVSEGSFWLLVCSKSNKSGEGVMLTRLLNGVRQVKCRRLDIRQPSN